MAGDGTLFHTWTKIWAEECHRAQGLDISNPIEVPEAICKDREGVMRSSGRNKGNAEGHTAWTILPFTPSGGPPKMVSPNHRAQVFYFSPESLEALKAEASPRNTIMAMQSPIETKLEANPVSVFNIAIDGRLWTSPPVHPETLGCFLEYVAASAPIRQMLASLSLADLAVQIRKAILCADNQFTDEVVSIVEKFEDVDQFVPTAFLDVPGNN